MVNPSSQPIILYEQTAIAKISVNDACENKPSLGNVMIHEPKYRDKLIETLKLYDPEFFAHLSPDEIDSIKTLINNFREIFVTDPYLLKTTNYFTADIHTGDHPPIKQRAYPVSIKQRDQIKDHIDTLLRQGIIVPSCSAWSSPCLLVKKKDGSTRLVFDYRKVNAITRRDAYPLPVIDDVLTILHDSKYFTTLDLHSGFHQVELSPEAASKTAFVCPFGHFEWKRLPFGLTNAPSIFQRLMEFVLRDHLQKIVIIYIDDIIIFSRTFNDHIKHLCVIFEIIKNANLSLKPSKCFLAQKALDFLGYVISDKGILTQKSKTDAIQNFPRPTTVKEIRRFNGMVGYYSHFIENYAAIARPLQKLTGKNAKFVWSEEAEATFNTLKEKMINPPILSFPDFTVPFRITTDASDTAIGIILSQIQKGKETTIAYGGRALTTPETRYNTTEKELAGVIYAIKRYRAYIYGTHFKIFTDHQCLKYLRNIKNPQGRLARWILFLENYDFEIEYKPGKSNRPADALSRRDYDSTAVQILRNVSGI